MKVEKRAGMLHCDQVCVEYVKVFTKPMGDHTDNTNPNHGYYAKEFHVAQNTLTHNGCDDCNHWGKIGYLGIVHDLAMASVFLHFMIAIICKCAIMHCL